MPKDSHPVRWVGRQAVVTLPEHIDVSNAGPIREELLSVINRGAAALIADMTETLSCDYAGADAVVGAYQRTVTTGTQLRLVVTARIVRGVLSLNGLDRLIPIYPSLEAATAAGTPAAEGPARTRIGAGNLRNRIHYTTHTAGQGRRSSGPSTAKGFGGSSGGRVGGEGQGVAPSRRADRASSSRNVASGMASRPPACTR